MFELFNRDFEMTVGTQKIPIQFIDPVTRKITPALRVAFAVEKSGNRDPNRATVDIYNLNPANRAALQTANDLAESGVLFEFPLVIEAGYAMFRSQIFSGDVVRADSRKVGTEWVTTIEAEDGGKKYRSARISQTFGKGTPVQVVLTALAAALGVGLGNSAVHFAVGAVRSGYLVFPNGVALHGQVSRILDKYITSAGYQWSIQDGQLQVLSPDETLLDSIVRLGAPAPGVDNLGLVGSPERGEKGVIKARSLLQPIITPGRLVVMTSAMIQGSYKATKVNHFGDTWGADWYTEFEGKPLA